MRFDVLTLFPEVFPGPLEVGVVGRALAAGVVRLEAHDLRNWGLGSRRQVDDAPFGGGPGMVLRPEPLFAAVRSLQASQPARAILMSAGGRRLDADLVLELAGEESLMLVCGRYEGVDQRVVDGLGLEEVSVGDFVLAGGELAAMALVEAVARHLPGTLGDPQSTVEESFAQGLPEYPQYTRPAVFEGLSVPSVLRSGDHAKIADWRRRAALERASRTRPDLLLKAETKGQSRPAVRTGGGAGGGAQ
jgi:tRNA (guanine37-N1)-methyltransferase